MTQSSEKPGGKAGGSGDGPIFAVEPDKARKAALAKKLAEQKKAGQLPDMPEGGGNGPIFEEKPGS